MSTPEVSVIMATFNHADFVARAIESVLMQRDVDFEFLIADDGSTDLTPEVVAAAHDERISFYPCKTNRGACMVSNELIQRAAGEFIAVINSDDYWISEEKLVDQLQTLEEDPSLGATFGRVRFVAGDGQSIEKSSIPFGGVFEQDNRSRGAWLRYFFDVGNCLCHPTIMIRRECYDAVGLYDNRLRQLPDFDMWIRLVKRYDIHVSSKEMVAFRNLPGQNASALTTVNTRRGVNETYFILRSFFDGVSSASLRDGFGDLLVNKELPDREHADIEQALLYFARNQHSPNVRHLLGLEKVHRLLGSSRHRHILAEEYGIDDSAFYALTAETGLPENPYLALEKELNARTAWALELNEHCTAAHRELDAAHRELRSLRSGFYAKGSYALRHPRRAYAKLRRKLH